MQIKPRRALLGNGAKGYLRWDDGREPFDAIDASRQSGAQLEVYRLRRGVLNQDAQPFRGDGGIGHEGEGVGLEGKGALPQKILRFSGDPYIGLEAWRRRIGVDTNGHRGTVQSPPFPPHLTVTKRIWNLFEARLDDLEEIGVWR